MAVCCILARFDDMPVKKSGIRTQESGVAGVAGVAEFASKVLIRKSGTGIFPGKSPLESQIL